MNAAVIYFSGTGNTEYVARKMKEVLEAKKIQSILIDTRRKKKVTDNYDLYVFGAPIYWSMFPNFFIEWVRNNIANGNCKRAIIFSTQADECAPGIDELYGLLKYKGFNVVIKDCIQMPNNYYIAEGTKNSSKEIEILKNSAAARVSFLIDKFMEGEMILREISQDDYKMGMLVRGKYGQDSGKWAGDNISVDYDACVKCGKCAKNCPARNISMKDGISFDTKCISCQRCIHNCPVNAFLFKGKKFEQYRI